MAPEGLAMLWIGLAVGLIVGGAVGFFAGRIRFNF